MGRRGRSLSSRDWTLSSRGWTLSSRGWTLSSRGWTLSSGWKLSSSDCTVSSRGWTVNRKGYETVLRSRGRNYTVLPSGAGAVFTNCNSGSFLFINVLKNFCRKKNMDDKEFFVSYYKFYPFLVQQASIHIKKYWYSNQKRYSSCQAGADRNIFGSATQLCREQL
jgi:hypothetical protein